MTKTKIKNWKKRLLLTFFVVFFISFTSPGFSAYAELKAGDCPPGWSFEDNSCTTAQTPGTEIQCSDFGLIEGVSTGTKKVCIEKPQPNKAQQAQIADTQNAITFIVYAGRMMERLIWPVLVMIGGLLDNSLLFGNGMEERLREIWMPIRNLVNILFVIALLGVALYNVLGIGDENGTYSIKSILPQIIIGIIAVNFSFLGIKVFLDGVNVLTSSVFTLPSQVSTELGKVVGTDPGEAEYNENIIRTFCAQINGARISDLSSDAAFAEEIDLLIYKNVAVKAGMTNITNSDTIATVESKINASNLSEDEKNRVFSTIKTQKEGQFCESKEGKLALSPRGEIFLQRFNSNNAALAMALNLSGMSSINSVPPGIEDFEKFAINIIFSFVLYILYLVSFLALFVVLLARLVVLWVSIAMSPILLLGMAVPAVKDKVSAFGTITEHFLKNALAPLYIAVAMAVGWIMLRALQGVNQFSDATSSIPFGGPYGIPVLGLSTLQDMVVALGTIAVIWLAVFTAASESIAAPVINFMKESVKKAGTFVATAPFRHLPVFPVKRGDGTQYNASGAEVVDAFRRIGQRQPSGLSDFMGLGGGAVGGALLRDLKDSSKVSSTKDFIDALRNERNEIKKGTNESARQLNDFKRYRRPLYEELIRKNPRMQSLLDDYSNTNLKEKDRAKIGDKLIRELDYIAESSAAAAAATAATGAPDVKGETKHGKDSKSVQEIVGEENTPQTVNNLKKSYANIKAEVGGKKDPEKLKKSLRELVLTDKDGAKVAPTLEQLEENLGADQYDKLLRTLSRSTVELVLDEAAGTAGGTSAGTGGGTPADEEPEESPTE